MKNFFCFLIVFFCFTAVQIYSQSWSSMGEGLYYPVNVIVEFNGGIYAGSDLVYKWEGNTWTAITNGMYGLFGVTEIDAMAVNNNTLFTGGTFYVTTPDQNWYNYAARLEGGSWTTCGSGTGTDGWCMDAYPTAMISFNNNLYAGGFFTSAGGDPLNTQIALYIARFDGSQWNPVGGGMNEHITDMTVYNNQLIVSGYFTQAGSIQANYIAGWDGSAWHSLGSGMSSTGVCKVTALAVHNGNLYAGGLFESAGGTPAKNIAKWNGSSWSALGNGINGQVYSLASYHGNLYAGGYFSLASGDPGNYIIKWNGSQWSDVNGGTDDPINFFLVKDNKLYAGGSFTMAGNQPANHIAVYSDGATAVDDQQKPATDGYVLYQNYPNPFNPSTTIYYQIPEPGFVTLKVYDILGNEIAVLVNEQKNQGRYSIDFSTKGGGGGNASGLAGGVYIYQLRVNDHLSLKKMILLK